MRLAKGRNSRLPAFFLEIGRKLKQKYRNCKRMEKYCISIDWLQTFCHGESIQEGSYEARNYRFAVKKENYETAQFKDIYTVYYQSHPAATIQQAPRTSVIHPRATCVKLANRVLYCEQYINMLYAIQEALSLTYKGITRLDICYDCNYLHDKRNVERFIRQFISVEPMEKGHIIRNGSSRFQLHGTRKSTSVATLNSIRWGSPSAKIGAYCYDKTLELIEVKDKPWIRKMWKDNGLDYDISEYDIANMTIKERNKKTEQEGMSEYVKKKVWRFEISIKCQGMDILNMSTAEIFRLSPKYLEHYKQIEKIFHIYAAKVFDFRINTGQKRIRNYHKMQIFESAPVITSKPYYWSRAADTGRMEKICYNKLQKLSQEYVDLAEPRRAALQAAMDFLQELQGKKASTVRLLHYTQYLNNLMSYKHINHEDMIYFGAMEKARLAKKEIHVDYLYETIYEYPPITEKECLEHCGIPIPEYISMTPPEYIW